MPARTFGEASRSQRGHSQRNSPPKTWSQQETVSALASKRMAAAGPSSPRPPHNRPWDSPLGHGHGHASAEEDELGDEVPLHLQGDPSPGPQRRLSTKRKTDKVAAQASSPKRSKKAAADPSPTAKSSSSYHMKTPSRGSSPQARTSATISGRPDESDASAPSARLLSPDEIDTFLDLIYKHHPEPMTAENMRQSVDALYRDWEQFCARRQVPVRLAKKPLMDEYNKIFNGVYGSDSQAKARSIAHELSQRSANSSANRDPADGEGSSRRGSGSRHSGTHSITDGDTNDDQGEEDEEDEDDLDQGDGTTGGDAATQSFATKKKLERGQDVSEGNQPETSSSKNSNIAQVGRNGLAVLPPGLFDILRAHLRDDILSSIMPSVRNDLTEQTRELFLQNQDLFGRIKEMEDRIRNQDLWIRHLLSRDPSDVTSPPVGPNASATGMAGADPRSNLFPPSAREPVHYGRPPRLGPLSSDIEMGPGVHVPMGGEYFDGPGPMSPHQNPRNETRRMPQPGPAGPHSFEGRMPPGAPGASMPFDPGMAAPSAFGSGRWEAEAHSSGAYRDRPPPERRPSYANEPPHHRRPGSWQGEMQSGRDPRLHTHPSERHDQLEGRYEPPSGPQPGQHRLSVGEARRLNSFGGGSVSTGGMRGAASGHAPPPSTGSAPSVGSMTEEFRRPGAPMHLREPVMSPVEPTYETRRLPPGLPISQSEAYFGSAESGKAPLPPRAMAAASPEQVQRNKRGRPSKAEMASSRGNELGTGASHGSFGGGSHPSAPSRPYLS